MKKTVITLFILGILSISLFAGGDSEDSTPTLSSDFADYSSWTKVNSETITGDITGVLGLAHERSKGFREIYVNRIGLPVELGKSAYPFPVGSIIVKEAYKNKSGSKGAMDNLTIMVKRESEYSSEHGDWEFIMAKPDGTIKKQGRMSLCINCHARSENKDYTFFDSSM